ncbi:hypothetical protein MBLNU230_g1537t1 [Neophaeotheca triangularis]
MSVRHRRPYTDTNLSSDSELDSDLDEEHQEALIHAYRRHDTATIALHRKLYLSIPLLAGLPSLLALLAPRSRPRDRLVALLALSTFVADACAIHFLPLTKARPEGQGWLAGFLWGGLCGDEGSPLERYLLLLNGALAVLVSLAGAVGRSMGRGGSGIWEAVLPLGMWVVTVLVREMLRPVDLEALERRRYGLKGA